MIIPDPPNQAMKTVELNLDRLNITNVDMGCQVIRRLGQYKVGENNQLEEIEEGELASRVYNLYEFNVDDYNEWAKDEIVDFRPVLAFRGIRFLMRDLSQSILNDNFKFIKRPLGGTETIVDLSDFDKEYNVLANDSPWSTWLKVREQQNIGVNSNTISVDVQTAPNELDQDLVYDSFQPPATRDVNQVTEYFPQDYIIENNKVVREQVGISGYNLDLDIMCLRSITVQPAQYPYTFSIADYNTQNNTNYVGVRKVIVNNSVTEKNIRVKNLRYYIYNTQTSSNYECIIPITGGDVLEYQESKLYALGYVYANFFEYFIFYSNGGINYVYLYHERLRNPGNSIRYFTVRNNFSGAKVVVVTKERTVSGIASDANYRFNYEELNSDNELVFKQYNALGFTNITSDTTRNITSDYVSMRGYTVENSLYDIDDLN